MLQTGPSKEHMSCPCWLLACLLACLLPPCSGSLVASAAVEVGRLLLVVAVAVVLLSLFVSTLFTADFFSWFCCLLLHLIFSGFVFVCFFVRVFLRLPNGSYLELLEVLLHIVRHGAKGQRSRAGM